MILVVALLELAGCSTAESISGHPRRCDVSPLRAESGWGEPFGSSSAEVSTNNWVYYVRTSMPDMAVCSSTSKDSTSERRTGVLMPTHAVVMGIRDR